MYLYLQTTEWEVAPSQQKGYPRWWFINISTAIDNIHPLFFLFFFCICYLKKYFWHNFLGCMWDVDMDTQSHTWHVFIGLAWRIWQRQVFCQKLDENNTGLLIVLLERRYLLTHIKYYMIFVCFYFILRSVFIF